MKMNSVLLIKPVYYGSHYGNRYLNAGLAYISEALSKSNIQNKIIDMGLGYNLDDLKNEISEYKTQLIGVSMMSFGYRHNYKMLEAIKQKHPDIPIVIGGPHMSTLRERVLKECPSIDYGITLEGEETIVELCEGQKPVGEIKGLFFRNGSDEIQYNGDRNFIRDLDQNGFPKYSEYQLNKYPCFINIVTSRGCPYHCIYCPVHLAIGRTFKVRSAQSVVDEFQYWYEKGYREFGIADDNFSLIRKRVLDICDEIERRELKGLKISCGNGLRADKVDKELLSRMKEVGFHYIAFGVEGGNNKVLEALQKSEKIETIEKAIKDACNLGYMVTLFFLLGSPGETRADVMDSVRLAKKYPVYDVRFYNLIPFQNTKLYEWVNRNNYFRKDPIQFISEASHWVNDPIFETPELSLTERKKLYKWANNQVKWHTLNIKKKYHYDSTIQLFKDKGFPDFLSKLCTKLVWNRGFRKIFMQEKMKVIIKNVIQHLSHSPAK